MKATKLFVLFIGLFFAAQVFAQDRNVKLATLEWEPYVGSEFPKKGFTAEIVKEAFNKAGYKVEIEFHTWSDCLKLGREGKADGIFPAYYSEDRLEHFDYSEAFATSPLGLCKIKTYAVAPGTGGGGYKTGYSISYPMDPRVDQTAALEALKQYTFGVVKDYANTPEFDAADFLKKVEARSDEELLRMLFRDEVQLIVIDKFVMQNIVAKKFPWRSGEVQFMEPPLSERRLFVAFSRSAGDSKKRAKDFNAGLQLIKEDMILDRIMRKYGF